MLRFLIIVLVVYGLFCLLIFFRQKNLVFFPTQIPLAQCNRITNLGGKSFASPDKKTRLYDIRTHGVAQGWVLVLHGNAGRACDRAHLAEGFLNRSFNVVIAEYPGYAEERDLPSSDEVLEASQKALEYIEQQNESELSVFIYGESIGTGPATYLGTKYNVKALIQQTPYTSLGALGQHHYPLLPVKLLITNDFKASVWAKDVKVPVFVFHGTEDEVIPFEMGKEQSENFPNAKFHEIKKAHHNDLFSNFESDVWKAIDEFMKSLTSG